MTRKATAPPSHEFLRKTLQALESAGLSYCLLRGSAMRSEPGTWHEADLLVDRRDLERFGQIVAGLGFAPVASRGYGEHHFYVAHQEDSGGVLELDVVTALRYGGRGGILGARGLAAALRRRRRDSGIYVPDFADAFLGLLLHCILDKKAFREDHRRELERLRAILETDGPARAQAAVLFQADLGRALNLSEADTAVRDGAWEALLQRRRRIVWQLVRREPLGSAGRWLAGKLTRLLRPGRPLRPGTNPE